MGDGPDSERLCDAFETLVDRVSEVEEGLKRLEGRLEGLEKSLERTGLNAEEVCRNHAELLHRMAPGARVLTFTPR